MLTAAFGYQGDAMNLPVPDVDAALPFYTDVLGFSIESRTESPVKKAVLTRDGIQMAIAETGGDPSQDGCAFHVTGLDELLEEFRAKGLNKSTSDINAESGPHGSFRVFYVVAPDGLCFWFGERTA